MLCCCYVPILLATFPRTSAERIHGPGTGRRVSVQVMLLCSHSPTTFPRTSVKGIHSCGTGRRASVQKWWRCYILTSSAYERNAEIKMYQLWHILDFSSPFPKKDSSFPTKSKAQFTNNIAILIKDVFSHLSTKPINSTRLTCLSRAINKVITAMCHTGLTC